MESHPFFSKPRLFLYGPNQARFILGRSHAWLSHVPCESFKVVSADWVGPLLHRFLKTHLDAVSELRIFYAELKGQLLSDFHHWSGHELAQAIVQEVGAQGSPHTTWGRVGKLVLVMEEPPWVRFRAHLQSHEEKEEKQQEPKTVETFFEVMFVDAETGEPVQDVVFEVEAGTKQKAKTNAEGLLRLDGLTDDLPQAVIYPSKDPNLTIDQCWLPASKAKEIGTQIIHAPLKNEKPRKHWMEVNEHCVKHEETLKIIADKYQIDVQDLCQFNFGTTDEKEIKEALKNIVGTSTWGLDELFNFKFTGSELPGKIFIPKPLSNQKFSYGKQHRIEIGGVRRQCHILKSNVPLEQDVGLANNRTLNDFILYKQGIFSSEPGKTQIPKSAFEQYYRELKDGIFQMPPIRLIPRQSQDSFAAFNFKTETIEISLELVCEALGIDLNSGERRENYESEDVKLQMNLASQTVLVCLLEEHGHYIDHILRNHFSEVGGDSINDEGALSAHTLLNPKWDSQKNIKVAEYIGPDSQSVPVVINTMEIEDLIRKYLNKKAISKDGKSQSRKKFEEGGFREKFGIHTCHGSGRTHETIERILISNQGEDFSKEPLFTLKEGKSIYFGNWLRDFSQTNLKGVFYSKADPDGGEVDIQSLTKILTELSEFKFGEVDHKFEVTEERLGNSSWIDHIDNPFGKDEMKGVDEAFQIDPETWMYNYIIAPSSQYKSAIEHIDQQIELAFEKGRTHEGLMAFGTALHALEDYFAHSNFCEIFMHELGHEHVYCWTKLQKTCEGSEETFFPIVTGVSEELDSFVSLSHKVPLILELLFRGTEEAEKGIKSWILDARRVTVLELVKWFLKIGLKSVEYKWGQFEDRLKEIQEFWETPFSAQKIWNYLIKKIEIALFVVKEHKTIFALAEHHVKEISRIASGILGALIDSILEGQIKYLEGQQTEIEKLFEAAGDSVHDFQDLFRKFMPFPTHTLLAKDHHTHVFHDLSSRFSKIAVEKVAIEMIEAWKNKEKQSSTYSSDELAKQVKEEVRRWIVHPQKMESSYRELFVEEARGWEQATVPKKEEQQEKAQIGHGGSDGQSGQRGIEANEENHQSLPKSQGGGGAQGYEGEEKREGAGGQNCEMEVLNNRLNIDFLDKNVIRLQLLKPLEHEIADLNHYRTDLHERWKPHPELKLELVNKSRELLKTRNV